MVRRKKKSFLSRKIGKGMSKKGKAYKALNKFANVWKVK